MKILRRILLAFTGIFAVTLIVLAWQTFPIISGYGAKIACSCVMVAGRSPDDVYRNELGSFPLSLGSYSVNFADSSASAHVFGLATRKAIFRKGLGCTLVVGIEEGELRSQAPTLPEPPRFNQDSINWPTGDRPTGDEPLYDSVKLMAVLDDAFREPGAEPRRRTRAVIVVYKGKIIAERYAPGFDATSKFNGWSMAKSITNAMVGILVSDGALNVNAPAPIEEWKDDGRAGITLNHLLHASSGLEWSEVYSGPSPATRMLFMKRDAGAFAAGFESEYEPGTKFYYSSGTTNIISLIIRKTVGDEQYYRLPYERLFYKIGMLNTVLEPDPGGTFVGSSFAHATARDWARFGLLYLNDGVWGSERILPEGWVEYTTTPAPAAKRGQYGAQFWLNAGSPLDSINRYFPDVPRDLFWADGYEGQNVFILPSKDLVVVKLSLSTGDYLDDNQFLKGVIASLGE